MSEFVPTTTVSFFVETEPLDDYDDDATVEASPVATNIPISILTSTSTEYIPAEDRYTSVKILSARIRGHILVKKNYILRDDNTGERYMIESLDLPHNPMGDRSWRLVLRRIDRY